MLTLTKSELQSTSVTVRTELAEDIPAVIADRVQIQQVMLNLVMNAIESMISITDRPRELLIKSTRLQEGVQIQVEDSGAGLDPAQAERLFDPFLPPRRRASEWGSRSAVRSLKVMADACR